MQWCGNGAAPVGYSGSSFLNSAPGAVPSPDDDCEDCVETRTHHRLVTIPCTKNVFTTQKYQVPRVVQKRVERDVNYMETVNSTREEKYQVMVPKRQYRTETEAYTVPVQKEETVIVPVTRKVPKLTYVDQVFQESRKVSKTVMEPRTRKKVVPYDISVPETRSRMVPYSYQVPKTRKEYQTYNQTVFDTHTRQVCTPVTKYVTKRVPYTTVHAKNDAPCPPGGCPPGQVGGAVVGGAMGGGMMTSGGMMSGGMMSGGGMMTSGGVVGGTTGGMVGGGYTYGGSTGYTGGASFGGAGYGGSSGFVMGDVNEAQRIVNNHTLGDANKDGKLTVQEAVAAFAPGGGLAEATVRAQHAAMDTNKDGVVDVNEGLNYSGFRQTMPMGGSYGGMTYAGGASYGGSGATYSAAVPAQADKK